VVGASVLESYGDIYVLDGSITSPGANLNIVNGLLSFIGSGTVNPAVTNYVLSSGTYNLSGGITASNQISVTGATATLGSLNASELTVSSGSLTVAIVTTGTLTNSGGTTTVQNLTSTGDWTISGGTVNHPATTTTTMSRLQATVGGNFVMTGGSVNVDKLGYLANYTYGPTSPTSVTLTAGVGGSHGGRGAYTNAPTTYDDYRNPAYPGGGGGGGAVGGGVFRLTTTGSCTINNGATITANGEGVSGRGAAGGTVYLNCASIGGTAGAGAISAKGGTPPAGGAGAGGGGRIALISSGDETSLTGNFDYLSDLSTFKSTVTAEGGRLISTTYGGGGAGTIYIKHSGLTYGDLIIDNKNQTANANNGKTLMVVTTANSSTVFSSTATKLQITNSSTPFTNMVDMFKNNLVHVFPTASSANPLDGSHYEALITSNDTNNLYATAASFPAISNNHYYRIVNRLDHIDIAGNAMVDITGGDLILMSGASDACDLHSGSAGAFDVPTGSSIIGNSIASADCKASLVTGTVTFTNTYLAP
jgi:hypothetical protein